MDGNSLLAVGLGEAPVDGLPSLAISAIGNDAPGRELQQEPERHRLNALLPIIPGETHRTDHDKWSRHTAI